MEMEPLIIIILADAYCNIDLKKLTRFIGSIAVLSESSSELGLPFASFPA